MSSLAWAAPAGTSTSPRRCSRRRGPRSSSVSGPTLTTTFVWSTANGRRGCARCSPPIARSARRPAARGRSRRAVRLYAGRMGTRRFRRRHAGAGRRRRRAVPGLGRPGRGPARLATRPRPTRSLRRLSKGVSDPAYQPPEPSVVRRHRAATTPTSREVPRVVRGADETDTRGPTARRRRVDAGLQ